MNCLVGSWGVGGEEVDVETLLWGDWVAEVAVDLGVDVGCRGAGTCGLLRGDRSCGLFELLRGKQGLVVASEGEKRGGIPVDRAVGDDNQLRRG